MLHQLGGKCEVVLGFLEYSSTKIYPLPISLLYIEKIWNFDLIFLVKSDYRGVSLCLWTKKIVTQMTVIK